VEGLDRLSMAVIVCTGTLVVAPVTSGGAPRHVTSKMVEVTAPGRSFPARLVYPTRGGPYPAIAFAHGYGIDSSYYRGTLRALASAGYVVIAPDSETGQFPSHSRMADDLNRSLRWLGEQSATGTLDVPRGKVNPRRLAVAGHSMGGGVALLAASRSHLVDTVATLAAADTAPVRASVAVRRLHVPSLFVVGSDDRIVPAAGTAVIFRRAPSPSLLATITGGSHCGFMETIPLACDAGRISYAEQLRHTRDQLRRWFDRHLRGRKAARITGVPGVRYVRGWKGLPYKRSPTNAKSCEPEGPQDLTRRLSRIRELPSRGSRDELLANCGNRRCKPVGKNCT
jgi:dienelactone hydrolase